MEKALNPEHHSLVLTEERMLTLKLAALLHDADDHKYFEHGSNNAETIVNDALAEVDPSQTEIEDHPKIRDDTLMMIGYVSASKNGNRIPDEAK